jgi:DMSO/TMAO reductase YedYZ molybdopterin-dependent catalytic subunit
VKKRKIGSSAAWGGLTSLAVIGLTYLGQRWLELPFVPFDVFDWLARVLPGAVINLTIDTMVNLITSFKLGPTWTVAKLTEQIMALLLLVGAGVILGLVLGLVGRPGSRKLTRWGILGGLVVLTPALIAEFSLGYPAAGPVWSILWLVALFIGWGALLGRLVQTLKQTPPAETSSQRRHFLWLVGLGSFSVAVGALGVRVFARKTGRAETGASLGAQEMQELPLTSGPAASPPLKVLEARFPPAPGTRPELTSNENFYRIDINTVPPEVDVSSWRLEVKGLVERPLKLTLADIASRPSVRQAITLSCISNPVGGDLISTAILTGVRLKDIMTEAGMKPEAKAVAVKAVDGFYESVPLAEVRDDRTLLVYAMNDAPLPVPHGYPLRIYVPGHYGMKQPKWITSLEAIPRNGPGYWVDRGWDEKAAPQTTSVIDTTGPARPRPGQVEVGGIAYSGDRGISRVQVQVDDGPWEEAELRDPPVGPLTWVQWRYYWRAIKGRHTIRVRAYDGTGALQGMKSHDPFPAGATGVDAKRADVV